MRVNIEKLARFDFTRREVLKPRLCTQPAPSPRVNR